mmetsp:Transcript_1312/g.2456  ORF Transcript_1312/g.2456 Transcript_1312/m.2456 type:complete len:99 (+) Transcript_1312:244-540(+)
MFIQATIKQSHYPLKVLSMEDAAIRQSRCLSKLLSISDDIPLILLIIQAAMDYRSQLISSEVAATLQCPLRCVLIGLIEASNSLRFRCFVIECFEFVG